jgi:small subunit ribosomal protein S17
MKKHEIGIVVGNKMNKTATVKVERMTQHPVYKKYIKRYTTYKAHDEENACNIGDKVLIVETRPLCKSKRWHIKKIVEKAPKV